MKNAENTNLSSREYLVWERDKYEEILRRDIERTKKAKPYRGSKIEKLKSDLENELHKVEKATKENWEEIKRNLQRVVDRAEKELREIERNEKQKQYSL